MQSFDNTKISKVQQRNKMYEKIFKNVLFLCALFASASVLFIVGFISFKAIKPFLPGYEFGTQSITDFLFGTVYRSDQGVYGIGFIIINTFLIVIGSILVSAPISIISALFVTKFTKSKTLETTLRGSIELLASIPSVIYGLFGYSIITKFVDNLASSFGYNSVQGLSMLSAILVLALMIYPTITVISISSIERVSKSIEEASYALGATKLRTNYNVVLRSAKRGIFAGIILGVGRSFGEATAVSMVIGNAYTGPTFLLFDPSRTMTSTILVGLKETSGLDYDIRFSIGLVLLLMIIVSNFALNFVRQKVK